MVFRECQTLLEGGENIPLVVLNDLEVVVGYPLRPGPADLATAATLLANGSTIVP
jgi:hypothetical protein